MASTSENNALKQIIQEGIFRDLEYHINSNGGLSALPILVQFKRPPFADDFVETGMKAEIVGIEIEREPGEEDLKLYFYFSDELHQHNKKFFKKCYYGRQSLGQDHHKMFTAEEVGEYTQQYSVYVDTRAKISEYLLLAD